MTQESVSRCIVKISVRIGCVFRAGFDIRKSCVVGRVLGQYWCVILLFSFLNLCKVSKGR